MTVSVTNLPVSASLGSTCLWAADTELLPPGGGSASASGHTDSQVLMSHGRKKSVRDKVTGKKWIYLDRNTLHRQSVGHLRRQEWPHNVVWLVFIGCEIF